MDGFAAGITAERRRPRAYAGFTLVEMLIALVITGVISGAVITLLMGQNRFYGSTNDVVYAEQSLRATSDLLATEIRGIAPRGDVTSAGEKELTFRMDLHRGVVCHVDASDDVYLFMFSEATAANVGSATGVAFREAYGTSDFTYRSFDPLSARSVADGAGHAIATTCAAQGGPTPGPGNAEQFWRVDAWPSPVPPDGSVVRIYGEVTYEFGPSGFGPGTGVFRNGQELAAPFESDASFSYVMAGGAAQSSVPAADREDITRIRIDATAVGDGANRYDITRDLQYDVPLRNRS